MKKEILIQLKELWDKLEEEYITKEKERKDAEWESKLDDLCYVNGQKQITKLGSDKQIKELVERKITKEVSEKLSLEKKQISSYSRFLLPSSSKIKKQIGGEINEIIDIFKIDKDEYEKFFIEKLEITRFEEEFQKKSIEEKFELIKEKLEDSLSLLESNAKIRELESNYQIFNEEEVLQKEVEIIEKVISLLEEKKNSNLLDFLKEKICSLKEKIIIEVAEKYLEVKRDYLNVRLEIAKELDECCKNLIKDNTNHQKRKIIIKGISDLLGTFSLSVKPAGVGFNINPSKLFEAAVSNANDYWEITFKIKCGKEFKDCLENNKNNYKSLLEESYNSLIEIIERNRKLKMDKIEMIINDLELEDKGSSLKVLKIFEIKHKAICSIYNNWEREYQDLDKMEKEVDRIIKQLSEFDEKIKEEKSRFKEIKEQQHQSQIEQTPKS